PTRRSSDLVIFEEFFIRVLCCDPTRGELDNRVATPHGCQPMRDDDDGELPVETLDGIHDGAFSLAIERARGFIEYQDAGLLVQCPGNADPLPLSARQPNAALSNHSHIALGPSLQKVGNLRLTRRVLDARE